MWLAEVLQAVPSMPVWLALASYSRVWPCRTHSGAGPDLLAGPAVELATPCVTYSQSGLMANHKELAGHSATILQVLVLSHLKRSQPDHL